MTEHNPMDAFEARLAALVRTYTEPAARPSDPLVTAQDGHGCSYPRRRPRAAVACRRRPARGPAAPPCRRPRHRIRGTRHRRRFPSVARRSRHPPAPGGSSSCATATSSSPRSMERSDPHRERRRRRWQVRLPHGGLVARHAPHRRRPRRWRRIPDAGCRPPDRGRCPGSDRRAGRRLRSLAVVVAGQLRGRDRDLPGRCSKGRHRAGRGRDPAPHRRAGCLRDREIATATRMAVSRERESRGLDSSGPVGAVVSRRSVDRASGDRRGARRTVSGGRRRVGHPPDREAHPRPRPRRFL